MPLLASHRRLLMPDLRGFGWTEAPGRGYDAETFASDAVALLDALELERVQLAGHDWGGYASLLAGLKHPERFSRILDDERRGPLGPRLRRGSPGRSP